MKYRKAQLSDSEQIALLHAQSWRSNYRGLFCDDFLDNQAEANRKDCWATRLSKPQTKQFVYIAEQDGIFAGFICAYGHEHSVWGSLIDNLHVAPEYHRQGVGTQLMSHTFSWLQGHFSSDRVYLWVMSRNTRARRFYEKLGALDAGEVDKPNPFGGGSALNRRYEWASADLGF